MTSPTGKTKRRDRRWRRADGFTLVELLLVVVLSVTVLAAAAPAFVRSVRAQRLESGARGLVAAGRYARAMAVLHAVPVGLEVDAGRGRVSVEAEPEAEQGATVEPLRRDLDERVRVTAFECGPGAQAEEGLYRVHYYPNGTSDGFTVHLEDDRGGRAIIAFDALTGDVSVTYER
jgi:general secretion pathway protein H